MSFLAQITTLDDRRLDLEVPAPGVLRIRLGETSATIDAETAIRTIETLAKLHRLMGGDPVALRKMLMREHIRSQRGER